MRIAVACDHAGFPLKEKVIQVIREAGHEPIDFGTNDTQSVDYPDFARAGAEAVRDGRAERGIILCGSGAGACMTANKVRGIRAGVCHDTYSARQAVEHDDMNVLCLGTRIIGESLMRELVLNFLSARFTEEERHVRRLNKMRALEEEELPARS